MDAKVGFIVASEATFPRCITDLGLVVATPGAAITSTDEYPHLAGVSKIVVIVEGFEDEIQFEWSLLRRLARMRLNRYPIEGLAPDEEEFLCKVAPSPLCQLEVLGELLTRELPFTPFVMTVARPWGLYPVGCYDDRRWYVRPNPYSLDRAYLNQENLFPDWVKPLIESLENLCPEVFHQSNELVVYSGIGQLPEGKHVISWQDPRITTPQITLMLKLYGYKRITLEGQLDELNGVIASLVSLKNIFKGVEISSWIVHPVAV